MTASSLEMNPLDRTTVSTTTPSRGPDVMKHYRNRLPRMIFVLATAVTLGLGTAACGGDSGDSDSTVAGAQSSDAQPDSAEDANAALVAYSQCMRENGVPSFPDPENGRLQIRGRQGSDMDPESSSFQAAQQACKDKEPPASSRVAARTGRHRRTCWPTSAACVRTACRTSPTRSPTAVCC